MAGPFSSVTAPRDGAHRKNRKKKINIKAEKRSERWYMDLKSEGENGGRERKVKVSGEWVTPGLVGGLPTGTETRQETTQTDRWQRHEIDRWMAWPQAPGPGLCLMQCPSPGSG